MSEIYNLLGRWRNGSAFDSRSKGYPFKSGVPQFFFVFFTSYLVHYVTTMVTILKIVQCLFVLPSIFSFLNFVITGTVASNFCLEILRPYFILFIPGTCTRALVPCFGTY